jgi:rhodanese-related sulfurtransferase
MFARFSLNQKLAGLALALGVVAIFATPIRGGSVSIEPTELAVMVHREVDHVTAEDLAGWIVQKRDYRLIDLRDEKAFAEYHIPGAELVPVTKLLDASIARNETVVLYSDGGIHSAQAWFLMRAHGYRAAYILLGGLESWQNQILFPSLAEDPTPFQKERNEKLRALSAHFGGTPQQAGMAAASPAAALPKVAMPPMPAGVAKKKKREGC